MRRLTTTYIHGLALLSMIALLVGCSGGGSSSTSPNVDSRSATTMSPSDAILGFEVSDGWGVTGGVWSATDIRTQGALALETSSPSQLTMTSAPVASTATALADLSSSGAAFLVDVFLPTPGGAGSLQLYVNSPSLGISNAALGPVDLTGLRPGTYHTVKFDIPTALQQQLAAAPFTDLTFRLVLNVSTAEAYRFDNLRARAFGVAQPGAGQSADLVAKLLTTGENLPGNASFPTGVVQVPSTFHLKLGNAGSGTTELVLGYDGKAFVTCTYGASQDGSSYNLTSCTGGFQAGDLIGANYATLTIIAADPTQNAKIRAQLALNPVGDMVGTDVIPPMPTWWGDCAPLATPVTETVTDPTTGTTMQIEQTCDPSSANTIVTDYFNQVNQKAPSGVTIKAPASDMASRFGDGSPWDNLQGVPPPPNDPPFDYEGHMNQGGAWDAYWRLAGNLGAQKSTDGSGGVTSDFAATLSADAIVWSKHVTVASAAVTTSTSTGSMTNPTGQQANSKLTLAMFGSTVGTYSLSAGVNVGPPPMDLAFDLPPIQIWIFDITFGVQANLALNANLGYYAIGFYGNFTPSSAIQCHAGGGISLGIASGNVDAKVDLLKVSTPVNVGVNLVTDTMACSVSPQFYLNGKLVLSSGGGEIDLVAKLGVCPFCDHESWTLYKWTGVTHTNDLFSYTDKLATISLAGSCSVPLQVGINALAANPEQNRSFQISGWSQHPAMAGSSAWYDTNCADFHWSVDGSPVTTASTPLAPGSSPPGCYQTLSIATTGSHTVALKVTDAAGNSGTASTTVNVISVQAGPTTNITSPVQTGGTAQGTAAGLTYTAKYCNNNGANPVTATWNAYWTDYTGAATSANMCSGTGLCNVTYDGDAPAGDGCWTATGTWLPPSNDITYTITTSGTDSTGSRNATITLYQYVIY